MQLYLREKNVSNSCSREQRFTETFSLLNFVIVAYNDAATDVCVVGCCRILSVFKCS